MQKLNFKDGLLYTDITIMHDGRKVVVDDVIVDTGAFHTIISPQFLDELDVGFSDDDGLIKASGYGGTVCYSVRKKIDKLICSDIELENIKLDFGEIDPNERVNGLLGLDFLRRAGVIIDCVDLVMNKKK